MHSKKNKHPKSKVKESLLVGDLQDLVNQVIEIDTFESKVDSDGLVVAFILDDEWPAKDLSRFIEKGHVDLIDAEVSPAPNEKGEFYVFVEFLRNDLFPEKLITLLQSIGNLTNNYKWFATAYKIDKPFRVTEESLKKHIRLERKQEEKKSKKIEEVYSFLKDTLLDKAYANDDYVIMERRGHSQTYHFHDLDTVKNVIQKQNLAGFPVRIEENTSPECRQLGYFLGEQWYVSKIQDYYILTKPNDGNALVLSIFG